MTENKRQALIKLGADKLADTLIELAESSNEVYEMIENLTATPEEKVKIFNKKLASLKRSKRVIWERESFNLANELQRLLENLENVVKDPLTGVKLVTKFIEADEYIFSRCDDSSGVVGDVFAIEAVDLFSQYASQLPDKDKLEKIVLKLFNNNEYGVRDTLIDRAAEYLPERNIRKMITYLQKKADKETVECDKRHYLYPIESLAKQIRDAKLFEETRIENWGELKIPGTLELAQIHIKNEEFDKALNLLNMIPADNEYMKHEKDELLKEIYAKTGDKADLKELLFNILRESHHIDNLDQYLKLIGNDKRDQVINDEIAVIMNSLSLNYADIEFLLDTDKFEEAEEYILKWSDQLNGSFYHILIPLAEQMESQNRYLAATTLYRSLLISILERGFNKAYSHAVKYLKKLDILAPKIIDWKDKMNHKDFLVLLNKDHGRKSSFWEKYNQK
ncbi:MAG: hypothetical protein K9M99_02920 [Candidatus Cloacimonetes bacterium]|nr:hypothetical protein [Candidatus Cloacimonadota bacterium]